MKIIAKMSLVGLPVLLVIALTRLQPQEEGTTIRGFTMGTTYTVRLASKLAESERRQWRKRIQAVLDQLNDQMSTYLPDSEISRFNRCEPTTGFGFRGIRRLSSPQLSMWPGRQMERLTSPSGHWSICGALVLTNDRWEFLPMRKLPPRSTGGLPVVAGAAGTTRPPETRPAAFDRFVRNCQRVRSRPRSGSVGRRRLCRLHD